MADKVELNVTFGYMDEDGKFHKVGELPDVEDIDIDDDFSEADVITDLLTDNWRLQGMVEAYERVLGITDDEE